MTADAVWDQRDERIDAAIPAVRRLVDAVREPDHATAVAETDAAIDQALAAIGDPPGWRLLVIILAAMVPARVPLAQLLGWTEHRQHYLALLDDGMHSCPASAAAVQAALTAEAQRVEQQRHDKRMAAWTGRAVRRAVEGS